MRTATGPTRRGGSPRSVRSGWMSCRCGAGCARRRDGARACWRGRRSESPRLSAYGEARPPDEANPPARGCTAGWGHAQATPLGDDLRRAPTRADAGAPQSQHGPTGSGDAGDGFEHNLKTVHRVRAMKIRRECAGHRRPYRLRTHGSALGFGQRTQARGGRQCLLRGRSLVRGVWSAASTPC
jgi:hypothetical protein